MAWYYFKRMKRFRTFAVLVLGAAGLLGQTAAPVSNDLTVPTYFSTTGARFSYYDNTLTQTTNLGIRVASPKSAIADVPAGLWTVLSVDATPRSQASSATVRLGARYHLPSFAGGNLIPYANISAGATTTATTAVSSASSGNVASSLLGNLQGGLGFIWRACHTFSKKSKVNCIADFDFDINSLSGCNVATSSVCTARPITSGFVGLMF